MRFFSTKHCEITDVAEGFSMCAYFALKLHRALTISSMSSVLL